MGRGDARGSSNRSIACINPKAQIAASSIQGVGGSHACAWDSGHQRCNSLVYWGSGTVTGQSQWVMAWEGRGMVAYVNSRERERRGMCACVRA